MKKSLLAVAVLLTLSSPAFGQDLATLKASNAQKSAVLKAIKLEMKTVRETVRIAKMEEKSHKLDEQIEVSRAKLAELKNQNR